MEEMVLLVSIAYTVDTTQESILELQMPQLDHQFSPLANIIINPIQDILKENLPQV